MEVNLKFKAETISLLNKICFTLICASRDGMDINIIIGILMLLCVWLFENTSAVKEFLGEGANMQFVIVPADIVD
jgi:intracellular protein transport protein USO1